MSELTGKPKTNPIHDQFKKILKKSSIPNCQIKLSTKNSIDLQSGYLFKNFLRHKSSILNTNSVFIEDIKKLNHLKAELQAFCEYAETEYLDPNIDCFFKDSKRVYIKNDKFLSIDVFNIKKNKNTKLKLVNENNIDYLLIFSYLRTSDDEIITIKHIINLLLENKRERIKIFYIFCPEIDLIVEDKIEIRLDDQMKLNEKNTEVNILSRNLIKNVIEFADSEEFLKKYNIKINFYYMENLSKNCQFINDVLKLDNLIHTNYVFYLLNHESLIINIAYEVNQIFVINDDSHFSKPENKCVNPLIVSEQEIISFDEILKSLKFDDLNKSNYEFIRYTLFYKTVYIVDNSNIYNKFDCLPCIRFLLPKSHDKIHKEIVRILHEKNVLEKFEIKGIILDIKEEVSNFLRFFENECEKEGIKISLNDIDVTIVKKIHNKEKKKKINFKVILKEENNNKYYFLKMGRIKDKIDRLYDEKNSKYHIFNKISVIQNFKQGDKFIKIPALLNFKNNDEIDLIFPEGKILIINYFDVIMKENNCQIKKQNELMKKNYEKWENRVVIYAITNYPKYKLKEYIDNNDLIFIQFYTQQKYLPCFDYLYEMKEKFPEIVIFNSLGTIVYRGNIDENMKIESYINSLLNTKEDLILNKEKTFIKNPSKSNLNLKLTKEKLKSLGKNFDKFYNETIYNKCEYYYKFKFLSEKKILFDENFNFVGKELKRIYLEAYLFEKEKNNLENYINEKVYSIKSLEHFKSNIILLKEEMVSLRKECYKCQSKLENKNLYSCYWCKISFCEECGELRDLSKLGTERYSHHHNLFFVNYKINAEAIKIETHKLGNNLFEKVMQIDFDQTEKFAECNGCHKYISKGYRFTCLNCIRGYSEEGYNDICEKCFLISKNSKHKKYKEIISNLKQFQHNHNTHSFLRVVYSRSYFDF